MPKTIRTKKPTTRKTMAKTKTKRKPTKPPSKVAWRKAPPDLVQRFEASLPDEPAVERRKMFGYPCAFVGGQMFAGLFAESVIVRLSEEERQAALASQGAAIFEPLPGRVMREYVVVPQEVAQDQRSLRAWLQRALAYAASLPRKAAKKR